MEFFLVYINTFMVLVAVVTGTNDSAVRLRSDWLDVTSEECGPINMRGRITGGKLVPLGQYPWMARVGYEAFAGRPIKFKCGGSLINRRYVLSAAHCAHGYEKQIRIIRLGEHTANTTEDCEEDVCAPPVQDIRVDAVLVHKSYNHSMVKHDICLIRLAKEAEYNEFVRPICLPHDSLLKKNYVTLPVEIAGWGIVDPDSQKEANTLLYVTLPVRDACACTIALPGLEIDSNQFCVGLETGEDSCTGDSGGPMMRAERVLDTKKYYVLGVVSVGKSYCGESPALYTNVLKYKPWILDTIASTEEHNEAKLK